MLNCGQATKNTLSAGNNITVDVANNTSKSYAERLEEYKNGKRDQAFLRSLAIMARTQKDEVNARKIASDYILLLKGSVDEKELKFVRRFTEKSSDPGYTVIKKWVSLNIKQGERDGATGQLEDIIFKEQVKAYLGDNPDWERIEAIIAANKPLDGELIRGLSVIYYLYALGENRPNAVSNLAEAASRYDNLYDDGQYNVWAWNIFEKTNDKKILEKALVWSKKSVDRDPKEVNKIDTYANLLYKLGRTDEAMKWEKKALTLDPTREDFKETLTKMEKGLSTWPEIK